ncbi:MAG TPA: YigZ family protein [Anaerolineae bacterium]|nr:YigZ family protein [Anaerolineae bacterium]
MSKCYPIPAGEARIELQVKNSRFIGRAAYTPSVEAAKAFIEQVKLEESGCTHAVYAFAVGHGATVTHGMSDAGEPSGTAGRPALAVVKGSDLGDVTVVIVRYFGGTKLGTGGLVKAYTEATQLVLAELPLTEKVERQSAQITVPYAYYEPVKRLVEAHRGQIEAEEFAAEVTLRLTFSTHDLPVFRAAVAEATSGQVKVRRDEI